MVVTGFCIFFIKVIQFGRTLILRLTEQDGCRGRIRFPWPVTVTNLLEDGERETDTLAYGPFEMLTVAVGREKAAKLLQ